MKRRLCKAPGDIWRSSPLCRDPEMVLVFFRSPPAPRHPASPRGLHPAQGPHRAGVPGNRHPQEAGPPQRGEAGGGEAGGGTRGSAWLCFYPNATPVLPAESHVTPRHTR